MWKGIFFLLSLSKFFIFWLIHRNSRLNSIAQGPMFFSEHFSYYSLEHWLQKTEEVTHWLVHKFISVRRIFQRPKPFIPISYSRYWLLFRHYFKPPIQPSLFKIVLEAWQCHTLNNAQSQKRLPAGRNLLKIIWLSRIWMLSWESHSWKLMQRFSQMVFA